MSYTDKATGVTVQAEAGVLPEGAIIKVESVRSGSDLGMSEGALALGENDASASYRVTFFDAAGNAVVPSGAVSVSVPLIGGYGADDQAVYVIAEDGSAVLVGSTAEGGMLTISMEGADELGYVVVARGKAAPVDPGADPADPDDGTNPGNSGGGAGDGVDLGNPANPGSGDNAGSGNGVSSDKGGKGAKALAQTGDDALGTVTLAGALACAAAVVGAAAATRRREDA